MNFRQQLRRVKLSEDRNIIIDCSIEILPDVLLQAQQVGLITDQYNIIVTCLDFHTLELEPFRYGGANITGLRLIDPDNEKVQEIMNFFVNQYASTQQDTSAEENDNDENMEKENSEDEAEAEAEAEASELPQSKLFRHSLQNP